MPAPIQLDLGGDAGLRLRQLAVDFVNRNPNRTGAERGNQRQQQYGALAEIAIRSSLGVPLINPEDHPLGYDILLSSGVKVDVKCRGGEQAFQETYESTDGILREAKHNLFARQVYDDNLDADVYVMTHLQTPSGGVLPGTNRQRNWKLFICGWVSKERAKREGVYLPRGSLTERGNSYFAYRGQEIEFYHRHLNGFPELASIAAISRDAVYEDQGRPMSLHVTSADAARITYDLCGRGLIATISRDSMIGELGNARNVKPILHANQYQHVVRWAHSKGLVGDAEMANALAPLPREDFEGI